MCAAVSMVVSAKAARPLPGEPLTPILSFTVLALINPNQKTVIK
jgi:hypothetical protein